MRARFSRTRPGLSYVLEFVAVCALLILGAAVADVYLVAPPPSQQGPTTTTAPTGHTTSQTTSQTTFVATSHGQYSSSVKIQCLPATTAVGAPVVCTATVTPVGAGGTGLTPTGSASFTVKGQGSFNPVTCTSSAGSLVCTVSYSPNPGSEGTHMVNASYPGDGFLTPSSASFALTATSRNSSTSVSCTPSTLPTGASANCNVTVDDTTGAGSYAPVGQVTFLSNVTGSFTPPGCTLSSGHCSVSYTPSSGSHGSALVTAAYGGDADHRASGSTYPIAFGKRSSSVAIQCLPSEPFVNQIANCQTTVLDTGSGTQVTPTGRVVFAPSSRGNLSSTACTLVGGGCSVGFEPYPGSEGPVNLSATYQGDGQHASGSVSAPLVVLPRISSTAIVCSPQTVPVSSGTTCIVTVKDVGNGTAIPPTGNVTFSPSTSGSFSRTWCALSAGSCAVTFTPGLGSEGTISLKASYIGDVDHSGSTTAFQITSVVRSTMVTISCTPAAAGSTSTCTITVSDIDRGNGTTPLGIVDQFSDGGWGGSFGSPSCHLTSGACTITYIPSISSRGILLTISATYEGDYDHAMSAGSAKLTPS